MPTSPADAAGQDRPAVMLSLKDVVSGYGGPPIVRGVSAQVGSGEIVTIVGPNGAGKSTLLKAIAGLLRVGSGQVVLGGTDITNQRTSRLARLGLGYVPQSNDVFDPLTVRENLEIGGYRVPRPELGARIDEITGLLPALGALMGRRAAKLSGGERKMVAVGRALIEPAESALARRAHIRVVGRAVGPASDQGHSGARRVWGIGSAGGAEGAGRAGDLALGICPRPRSRGHLLARSPVARTPRSRGGVPRPGSHPRSGPAAEHPGAAVGAAPGARSRAGDDAAMSRPLTVAICQLRWSPDPGRNLDQGLAMAAEGFSGGANVVLLPELAVPGYTADPRVLAESAQTLNGPAVKAWQRAAAAGGGYIVGGLCERDGSQLYDSAVMVSGDGLLTCYRKAHLFDGEKNVFAPGNAGFPVVSTGYGTFGICICYDLRFVEVLRILALQGAELVLVPSAWVSGFDRGAAAAASLLDLPGQVTGLLVQANLNQVFTVAASFAGPGPGVEFLGCSVAAGPYGYALAGPLPADTERVAFAHVDLDEVAEAGRRTPLVTPREDRRRDLYSVTHLGHEL